MEVPILSVLGGLPAEKRTLVDAWLREFPRLEPPIQASLAALAAQLGVSLATVRRRYDAWRRGGAEAVVRAEAGDSRGTNLPEVFLDYWQSLCERNQRACRPAWRQLVRAWRSGQPIPGYEQQTGPRTDLPAGWSYGNLMRHRPTDRDLAVMRQGRAAAAPYLPRVFGTRKALWVGSHVMFDDVWHDNFVLFRGRPVRVMQLAALDVYSGCLFSWGCQPRIKREDGSEMGIPAALMRMLLASVVTSEGYSPNGTELVAERGTAAIEDWVERLLADRSNQAIRVRRSGITGEEQAVAGMFHGAGRGNPRFKAALEAQFNLLHNELASLPGQTGLSVDRRPEELAGLLDYETALARAGSVLPAECAANLHHPLLDFHQFLPLLADAMALINGRFDHNLEGWAECGHVITEHRLSADSADWLSPARVLALPANIREPLIAAATRDARLVRQRPLAPSEVWAAGRANLIRLPRWVATEILGPEFARELKCHKGYFEFQDAALSPSPLRYESRVADDQGRETELRPDTYQCYANPVALDALLITDARGRYLGAARRDVRISRADVMGLERRFGRVAQRQSDLLSGLARRHARFTRQRLALFEHNSEILQGARPAGGARSATARTADHALEFVDAEEAVQERSTDTTAGAASEEFFAALSERSR
jgi:hypothetical protein